MCDACPRPGLHLPPLARRGLLFAGAGLLASATLPRAARAQPVSAAKDADQALALLMEGNARYVANKVNDRDFNERPGLAAGQAPFAAILGCADSRVSPELAFDRGLGDLFVVRVAGNMVTSEGLGSLEYGAAVLGTKLLMVLGHSSCGAVHATVSNLETGKKYPAHIAELVRELTPAVAPVVHHHHGDGDVEQEAVVANVRYQVAHLLHAQPIIAAMVAEKKIKVVGAVYDLASGKVDLV